jgi:hypothetical protein
MQPMALSEQQRRANRRLGLSLALLAALFALGFVVRLAFFPP